MLFGLGKSGITLSADMPDYSEGRPDDRHRTQYEDAVQNSHRGEDNKKGGQEQIVLRVLRGGFPCQHLTVAADRPESET